MIFKNSLSLYKKNVGLLKKLKSGKFDLPPTGGGSLLFDLTIVLWKPALKRKKDLKRETV